MEQKLQQLFDYQKFMNEKDLQTVIDACDAPLEESPPNKRPKAKIWKLYRKSVVTLAGAAVAATLVVTLNWFLGRSEVPDMRQNIVGSLFSNGNASLIVAGIILVLGILASVFFFRKDRLRKRK